VGLQVGKALSLVTGGVAKLRHARMFHPEGAVLTGKLTATTPQGKVFEGQVVGRLSSAWWRGGKEWMDALGLALRIQDSPEVTYTPGKTSQDLLFATIRSPWTTLLAPLSTTVRDFLQNDYYAVSPFDVPDFGRARLRLVSQNPEWPGATREEKLRNALAAGPLKFQLELQRRKGQPWASVAKLTLDTLVPADQDKLRFSPFLNGRGVVPRGFVHALRVATYRTSQALGHPA